MSGEIAASAYESEGRTAKELVDEAERRVFENAEAGRRTGSGFVPLKDILGQTIGRLDMLHENQGQLTGVATGYTDLDRMTAGDFYRRDHQQIFSAIAELSAHSEPSDAVTLAEYLAAKGQADETGGLAYLAGLARDTPTAANIRAYADIVRERSLLRNLIRVSGEIAASAYASEGRPARDLVDEAERRVVIYCRQRKWIKEIC